jgi:hypothetical protein
MRYHKDLHSCIKWECFFLHIVASSPCSSMYRDNQLQLTRIQNCNPTPHLKSLFYFQDLSPSGIRKANFSIENYSQCRLLSWILCLLSFFYFCHMYLSSLNLLLKRSLLSKLRFLLTGPSSAQYEEPHRQQRKLPALPQECRHLSPGTPSFRTWSTEHQLTGFPEVQTSVLLARGREKGSRVASMLRSVTE